VIVTVDVESGVDNCTNNNDSAHGFRMTGRGEGGGVGLPYMGIGRYPIFPCVAFWIVSKYPGSRENVWPGLSPSDPAIPVWPDQFSAVLLMHAAPEEKDIFAVYIYHRQSEGLPVS